jgi:hypothetical protein
MRVRENKAGLFKQGSALREIFLTRALRIKELKIGIARWMAYIKQLSTTQSE